jgi:hypothetical protein
MKSLIRSAFLAALLSLGLFSNLLQAGWMDEFEARESREWRTPAHRIADSGYWVHTSRQPLRTIYWVDSNRVIFIGGTRAEWERYLKEGFGGYAPYLYVWDTQANRVSVHSKLKEINTPCYSRGYISYRVSDDSDDQLILKSGLFGQETERLLDKKHFWPEVLKSRGMLYSKLRCKEYPYADILIGEKRGLFPLLEGHGFLDIYADPFIQGRKTEPVRWFVDRNSTNPMELPIIKYQTAEYMVSYVDWMDSYLIATNNQTLHRCTNQPAGGRKMCRSAYIMKPGVATEMLNVPHDRNITDNLNPSFPMKVGMLILSGSISHTGPGKAGVYIWTGRDKMHRVIAGSTDAAALSPDGCKLAVAIDPRDHGGPDRYYLKMIDFCVKEGK